MVDGAHPDLPRTNDVPFRPVRQAAIALDTYLVESIAALSPAPQAEGTTHMRGMKRLANLAPTITAAIDAEADKVADRLVAQQERAKEAIGKFSSFADSIGQTADEIEAALGQLTNDPTQASTG